MNFISESENHLQKVYRILIIEDSLADFELYQKFLAKDDLYQYYIDHAETGAEGLELFLTHTYNLMLVDFSLPDTDGLECIKAIRKIRNFPKVPTIMLTGQGNEAIALEAMKQQIQDYWIKGELEFHKFIYGVHQAIAQAKAEDFSWQDNRIQVLIVDDSEADVEMYTRFLRKDPDCRFQVDAATTGEEALDFLKNQAVDIILVDYQLPDMSGIELIQGLQRLYPLNHYCTVMMTGQGSEKTVVEAIKNGASDYLIKQDITSENLRMSLKNVLEQFRLLNSVKIIETQKNIIDDISVKIRQSLELEKILQTSVAEVKKILRCDRALIYHLGSPAKGGSKVVAESVNEPFTKAFGLTINDTFFQDSKNHQDYIVNCRRQVINNVRTGNLEHCHLQLLEKFQVKAIAVIPIVLDNSPSSLWGLLIVHFCQDAHFWTKHELNFLNKITAQIGIAIQQGLLLEELKKERDRANEATESKSVFLANMSHEIRTPMNGILGMAEILAMSNLSEEQQDYVNTIQASGRSLLTVINDILDFSKLESGKIQIKEEEFCGQDMVKELFGLFLVNLKEKDVSLNLKLAEDLPSKYLGDPDRLKQILINLVGNAVKFTERGQINISIKKAESSRELQEDEIELYFAVEDTGIGIALEDQNQLFQPFSQVENSRTRKFQGTGLGLSICKKLVDLMGGEIGVKSETNQGSTFWFKVPLKLVERSGRKSLTDTSQASKTSNISSVPEKSAKILVVEDNRINQKLIKNQIKKLGYDCEVVENGAIALEKIQAKSYDLILMDCQMPVLNGYDATRQIRENKATQNIIIIGLTAYSMKEDKQKCIDAGMNDYLSKPCELSKLQEMIERWT